MKDGNCYNDCVCVNKQNGEILEGLPLSQDATITL